MNTTVIGRVLPYLTIIVFAAGMIYRVYWWAKLPRPKMTLFPAPREGKERFLALLKETFFFTSLFKADRGLWFMGWVFHAMLALAFIGHLRVLSALPDRLLSGLGLGEEDIQNLSTLAGGAAGLLLLATAALILVRRLVVNRVRQISTPGDYAAMVLILGILVTGDAMRFFSHLELSATRDYFHGLFTFGAASLPANPWFQVHFFLGQLLIMYIPFSKILHFGGIFFTETLIQES